jgi:hypothetical protein
VSIFYFVIEHIDSHTNTTSQYTHLLAILLSVFIRKLCAAPYVVYMYTTGLVYETPTRHTGLQRSEATAIETILCVKVAPPPRTVRLGVEY